MGEIIGQQVGISIQPEAPDHQALEVACEEVGEIEGSGLSARHRFEIIRAGKEGIAMRPLDPLDPFFGQNTIELAACPAIAVDHEDAIEFAACSANFGAHGVGDTPRPVVQFGGKASEFEVVPAIGGDQRLYLASERAAGNQ